MSAFLGDPGQPAGWCLHYRAEGMKVSCEAGVNMERWRGVPFDQRPCFLNKAGGSRPGAAPCEHLLRPTPEQIAAHKGWVEQRMEALHIVMQGISDWRNAYKGQSAAEVVECPACQGKLHLSISGYNGHVYGYCETEGCVSWME